MVFSSVFEILVLSSTRRASLGGLINPPLSAVFNIHRFPLQVPSFNIWSKDMNSKKFWLKLRERREMVKFWSQPLPNPIHPSLIQCGARINCFC